jgi:hypothetical protein
MARFRLPMLVTAALVAAPGATAQAQSTGEAEKLFRDGKALMKQGKTDEACDAFEASQRMESNISTVLSLADCREKNGQLASAWGWFLKAESMTRGDPGRAALNATARRRSAALEPRLSYLIINVPDESRIDGLVVSRNGIVVDPGTWNRALPIDGGAYEIEGKAPAHEKWSAKVTVKDEADRQSVDVPRFKELPRLLGPAQPPTPESPVPVARDDGFQLTTERKIAIGVGGASLVALGTGIVLGVSARNLDQEAVDLCPAMSCTDADASRANARRDRANSRALGANVAFGVSAAAAIGAGVLWYLGRDDLAEAAPADEDDAGDTSALRVHPHVGAFTGVTLDRSF